MKSRTRPMISPARIESFTMRSSACLTSSKLAGCAPSQRTAAAALAAAAPIGCLTSWAIEAVSCPIVATRFACASSICTSR